MLACRGGRVQDVVEALGSHGQRHLGSVGCGACEPVAQQERVSGQSQVLTHVLPAGGVLRLEWGPCPTLFLLAAPSQPEVVPRSGQWGRQRCSPEGVLDLC